MKNTTHKNIVWAKIARVFSSLGLVRSAWLYFLAPTVGWFILILLCFIILGVITWLLARSVTAIQEPLAWLS